MYKIILIITILRFFVVVGICAVSVMFRHNPLSQEQLLRRHFEQLSLCHFVVDINANKVANDKR